MQVSLGYGLELSSGSGASLSHALCARDLTLNNITSIESGDFTGLGNLTSLSVTSTSLVIVLVLSSPVILRYLYSNKIASIESGDLTGLNSLTALLVRANLNNILVLS